MINDYEDVRECEYQGEHYSVRDNGAIMRHSRIGKKKRPLDDKWTLGKPNEKAYLQIAGIPVHRIVATAFLGTPNTPDMIVDHIDTNHQNNRPSNLRWVTRFENVVNNPITVAKIIYRYGSLEEFWKQPDSIKKSFQRDDSWMRPLEKYELELRKQNGDAFVKETMMGARFDNKTNKRESTKECIENNQSIDSIEYTPRTEEELKKYSFPISELQMADDYKISPYEEELRKAKEDQEKALLEWELEQEQLCNLPHEEKVRLGIAKPDVQSLNNPIAMQRDWNTPSIFMFCPRTIGNNPIQEYADAIRIGELFCEGIYKNYVVEYTINTSGTYIILKTHILGDSEEEYDPNCPSHCYGVMEISVENGKFIHEVHPRLFYEDECNSLYEWVVEQCNKE